MGPLQDVLELGETVRCVVLGMADDFSRISLSTAELEEHDGDMKRDKVCTVMYDKEGTGPRPHNINV